MPAICFYFQIHQPYRFKRYRVFDIGNDSSYFNDKSETDINNKKVFNKVAKKCYIPATKHMLDLLHAHPEFKVSYSFSGMFLEQALEFNPEIIELFKKLVETGRVELLGETYYHSLSFLFSKEEFKSQVHLHNEKIKELFGVEPTVFRNTELIYNNELAKTVEEMGYRAILAEGVERIMPHESPNYVYKPKDTNDIRLLLKNYKLSDDIAFRFSEKEWDEHPLTAKKYADWINSKKQEGDVINLFMDYETFGEHQWEDTGIFEFLKKLPEELLNSGNSFVTPTDAIEVFDVKGEVDTDEFVSWADQERDVSAWMSNSMQHDAAKKLYALEEKILQSNNQSLIEDWRKLQTSDHFYYMCTKSFGDGIVHRYFNPYETPYEAFIAFMNVLQDMNLRLEKSVA